MKPLSLFLLANCMTFLMSCLGLKKEQHIYLAGWEAEFNGDAQCQKFLQTQVIDQQTAYTIWNSIDLVFQKGKLVRAYDIEEGQKHERKLKTSEIGFPYQTLQPNQLYKITQTNASESYLGGEIPKEFKIPKFDFNVPFVYLGKVAKSDKAFNWLPFNLHIAAPIYSNFDKLFVDYSNPLQPKVLNAEELKNKNTSDDDLRADTEIIFERVYIKTEKAANYGGIGITGVPDWIQYPEIPSCPKSRRTMKLLCQLRYDGVHLKATRTTVNTNNEYLKSNYNHMNFWGGGDLYIFFEPTTKVMCYFIQST